MALREMPEVDFTRAKFGRNPYARRVAGEGISVHVAAGRPEKGTETGPTIPRSVRFSAGVWKHLEQRAKAEGIPLHAALRAAVLAWVNSSGSVEAIQRSSRARIKEGRKRHSR